MMLNGFGTMLLQWVVAATALLLTSYLLPGFRVRNFGAALMAAVLIGLSNLFIRPFLMFLALPFNILTLGLFTFVVNAAILKLAAALLKDFEIRSWFSAILGAVVLAVINTLFYFLLF